MTQVVHFRLHPGYVHVVSVPEDFRVSVPRSFEWLIDEGRRGEPTSLEGVWVRVEGGGIPVPMLVRIERTKDDRFVITGMLLGQDEHREITWTTLRQIKPASILSMIFAGWDPRLPERLVDEAIDWRGDWEAVSAEELASVESSAFLDPVVPEAGSDDAHLAEAQRRKLFRSLVAYDVWRRTAVDRPGSNSAPEEVTRPRASVATNLTAFADAYRRNLATDPRRATTATAQELHISRATAIRRLAECRDLGLLPQKEKSGG